MKEPTTIAKLADTHQIPHAELQETVALIIGIAKLPKQKTTKEKIRRAERSLKRDPDDMDAWSDLFNMRAGQRLVIFNTETREITEEPNDAHKKNSCRTDHRVDAAIVGLVGLWDHHHDPAALYYDDPGLAFVADVLNATGILRVKDIDNLRKRLGRIRKRLNR